MSKLEGLVRLVMPDLERVFLRTWELVFQFRYHLFFDIVQEPEFSEDQLKYSRLPITRTLANSNQSISLEFLYTVYGKFTLGNSNPR